MVDGMGPMICSKRFALGKEAVKGGQIPLISASVQEHRLLHGAGGDAGEYNRGNRQVHAKSPALSPNRNGRCPASYEPND